MAKTKERRKHKAQPRYNITRIIRKDQPTIHSYFFY